MAADPVTILIQVGIALAAAIIAGRLAASRQKGLKDDKPTTVATRGAYVPWVLGRRRIGAVFGWAGDRRHSKESAGGKGSLMGGPEVDVYYESGWHQLCMGRLDELTLIQKSGKVIFRGPITVDSHPSGSTVDLGKNGSLRIFWGQIAGGGIFDQNDQPVNTYLGAASRVGVMSRWPGLASVEWRDSRLGSAPRWEIIDYTVFKHCHFSENYLGSTLSYVPPTFTLDGPSFSILGHVNGGEGSGYFETSYSTTARIHATDRMALAGNAMPDGDVEVLRVSVVQVSTGDPYLPFEVRFRIYPVGGVSGANDSGTLQLYSKAEDDGLNPAHCIAEILFGPWPTGLGLDPSKWNVSGSGNSLDALGVLCEAEGLRSSLIAQDGETLKSVLVGLLQDLGVLVPLNTQTGLIDFVPVRDETGGTLPFISADLQTGTYPEIETLHGEPRDDRINFVFSNRKLLFRDETIGIGDDGRFVTEQHQRARKIEMPSVVDPDVAAIVAERRSQETLGASAVTKMTANRGTRDLMPGQVVEVEGLEEPQRVLSVKIDVDSADVELEMVNDFMGTTPSTTFDGGASNPATGDSGEILAPLMFDPIELPEVMLPTGDPITLVVPHVRSSASVSGTTCWVSIDNVTYYPQGTILGGQIGGTLDADLSASRAQMIQVEGPSITVIGPDIANALDLSGDVVSWTTGRQLCVIVSDAGTEICFVQALFALGGDQYRLDGLIRGRYDTVPLAHSAGASVYVFPNDDVLAVQDLLLAPGAGIYVKMVPTALSLDEVAPRFITLRGKGITPMDPLNVRVTNQPAATYSTGGDVEVGWDFRTAEPYVGADQQAYAAATTPAASAAGSFVLEFLTTGDVLKRSVGLAGNVTSYTYTNATLVADFGLEPSALHVRVRNVNGSFESDNATLTITKV